MTDRLVFPIPTLTAALALDRALEQIQSFTKTTIVLRGQELWIEGEERLIHRAVKLLEALEPLWSKGSPISEPDLISAQTALDRSLVDEWKHRPHLARTRQGQTIQTRTWRQQHYVNTIESHDLTFGIGPAGTGKTFLAAVLAVKALQDNVYDRLILTRPAVEAGEKLGFLPGDLQQKISPYLRPLYDALYELMEADRVPQLIEKGIIEIAPLAYMRGRTLNRSFIIVDEAQNTTPAQMKMLLTRLGSQSKMVVTGDISQTDLPPHQTSGLIIARNILRQVEGIGFVEFTRSDVVRHPLVQRIIAAYDRAEL
ncbi:MAG: phosphate starvation-inducible protein PhoH [Cyanobacteria bacterium M5B4]|nr:MAG: phosphate starvation-inducible protein PhoH [Cyanobacteria bacterium M5B4]